MTMAFGRRARLRLGLVVPLLCCAADARSQAPPPNPGFAGTAHVNVVNVEVVVTDRAGVPATDLTREEFAAFHDGRPVAISNFVPPAAVPAGSGTRGPLSLFVVLDADNLSIRTRKRLLGRLGEALAPLLADGRVRAMLAEGGPSVRVREPLSGTTDTFLAALGKAASDIGITSGGGTDEATTARVVEARGAFSQGRAGTNTLDASEADALLQEARSAAQFSYERAKASLLGAAGFVDTLAGVPGRKALLLVSEGIPMRPGEAVLRNWQTRYGAASGSRMFSAELESAEATVGPQIDELAARASAAGVAIYCLDAGLDSRSTERSAEAVGRPVSSSFANVRETSGRFVLQSLSAETGGRSVPASGDLDVALAGVVDEAAHAYSVGIAIPGEPDGMRHTLGVEVARPGVQVRLRRSYVDKTPDQRAVDRGVAAVLHGATDNPLGIRLSGGTEIPQDDGTIVVPVSVHVPIGSLTLLPEGDVHAAHLSYWLAARDAAGRIRQVPRQSFTMRIPNQKLLDMLGQGASASFQLVMRTGRHRVAATLRDDLGGGASTATIELDVGAQAAAPVEPH
ncbi:MAG: VWA domain-containing protein [Acidobacteria bacterium]|nr:VWA domain-containing protein [Acidobacteriota bacterium]